MKTAVVADEVGKELLTRLAWLSVQPDWIIDIGGGVGTHAEALALHYPQAKVMLVDTTESMLTHQIPKHNIYKLCNSSEALALADQSVDFVFANFLLPWQPQLVAHLKEWRRVLRPNGVLLFSALGPDSLRECESVIPLSEQPMVIDMHDLGDALVHAGFAEPVLETHHYTLQYREPQKLFHELLASGMWMPESAPDLSMISYERMPKDEEQWVVTYEAILAHAFAPVPRSNEVKIPLSQLKRRHE